MRSRPLPLLALVLLAGCIHRFYDTEAGPLEPTAEPVSVDAALRVHLAGGDVALFRDGAVVGPDAVEGRGIRYDVARLDSVPVRRVPMDSVIGIESYREELNRGKTVAVSTAATLGIAALTIACVSECFGSCPTVYTDSAGTELLEAELFSYSIAPLLEGRDVDVLGTGARDGVVRLDVRNEAMETHFINHLQLLEVRHAADESVAPDLRGLPVAWRGAAAPERAVDGGGRVVLGDVAAAEGRAFATTAVRLAAVGERDLEDALELTFPRPGAGADSAVLVLDLRNSLLNTVLFYDLMLGAAGARALDWMGSDLERIGDAVRLGHWWSRRMGLHVSVWREGAWHETARLPDTGPIAWTRVAIPVPVAHGTEPVRVRLRFPADAWRIDRVALARFRRPEPRPLKPARLLDVDGVAHDSALEALAKPDEAYVQTVAGDRFAVEFDVGPEPATGARTFLVSSQGYYTEWVRPAWVRAAGRGETFAPSDASLLEAMQRWRGVRAEFERQFYETRIPAR